jgi:hypothetical protein
MLGAIVGGVIMWSCPVEGSVAAWGPALIGATTGCGIGGIVGVLLITAGDDLWD